MSLACLGSADRYDAAARTNLRTFKQKFLADGLPALDQMGGIWAESSGHGSYGPLLVVPYSYQAARTGLGIRAFEMSKPHGFMREYMRVAVFTLMPHNDKMAWIDDSGSGYPRQQARVAPILCQAYKDGAARWFTDRALAKGWLYNRYLKHNEVWQRIAFLDPAVKPTSPKDAGWPLAYHFRGAGHVYMRGAWGDPAATWAFFGAGPSYAGHSRDDEGHFLITRRGQLVTRSGGGGHNDDCYYSGGSLIYNIVTIYAPEEKMRRDAHNENDGGLLRYVYDGPYPRERGRVVAFDHDDSLVTYAAADLTKAYWSGKAKEVTRQFVYVRSSVRFAAEASPPSAIPTLSEGPAPLAESRLRLPEFFVIFDRVESTRPDYPKTWFLHLPSEPAVTGATTVKVPGHVTVYDGDTATWLSAPAGDTHLFSKGNARATLKTLLPAEARITRRGGEAHDFWGHPHNPKAQYNHVLDRRGKPHKAYRRPPFSPWRLEVEPTERRTRDYFLHVLTVTDDAKTTGSTAKPVGAWHVTRIDEPNITGARMTLGPRAIEVRFTTTGALGGGVRVLDGARVVTDRTWPATIREP